MFKAKRQRYKKKMEHIERLHENYFQPGKSKQKHLFLPSFKEDSALKFYGHNQDTKTNKQTNRPTLGE